MLEYPLVTIVTPSYNQGQFIEATILSVLDQNYPNLEYLIIDGGSTDNTLDILQKYEDKLKWISEKDKGQSDAINKGFKMAQGEVVAWLNSDDTYEPGAIFAAIDYFQKHENVALVYGEGDIIDELGNKVKRFEATQEFDLWTLIHVWDYIMQPTTFFKRDALQRVGYLEEGLHYCMDWDLWIKLASVYDVGYINLVLANSREYADTKTSTGGWKRFNEIVTLMRKYGNKKYPPGYYSYWTSTLYAIFKDTVILKFLTRAFLTTIHIFVFSRLPIKYKDNWIGPVYSFCLKPDLTSYSFEADFIFDQLLPMKLKIYDDKRFLEEVTIEKTGKQKIILSFEAAIRLHFINVKCNKSFIPSSINKSNDKRKLSYMILN